MLEQDIFSILNRVLMRVEIKDKNGCWTWIGTTHKGYGFLDVNGKKIAIHRLVFEYANGPIPHGFNIDHLCRNRACFNPDHLEVVTPAVNTSRGISPSAINSKKTTCINGHTLMDQENTYINPTSKNRSCKICTKLSKKLRNIKLAEEKKILKNEGVTNA